jgi:hypothetical protein
MRAWIVLVVVTGCSDHRRHEPPPPPAPKPVVSYRADRLVDRSVCVSPPAAGWAGKWDGARPFDNANPLAHRGPTRVTITGTRDKLHISEGVGAAGYQLDVSVDGDIAHGENTSTSSHGAVSLETGERSEIVVTNEAAVAACFDRQGALHLWRILGASGQGIQTTHEEDEVVLDRVPVQPVAPPPAGFHVLADDDRPVHFGLTRDEVVWSSDNNGVPVISAIRAVPRKGGAVREVAKDIPFIKALVVHGDNVYFAGSSSIGRVPLAGGKPETIVGGINPMQLAVDDKLIAFESDGVVQVVPLAGGEPHTLYTAKDADIVGFVLDAGSIYVAVRPAALEQTGTVLRMPETGGGASVLAHVTMCGDNIAIAAASLLVPTCEGTIVRISMHGGGAQVVAKHITDVAYVAAAGSTIVFAVGAGNGVIGSVAGGKQGVVLHGDFDPQAIAIDPADPKTAYVLDRGLDLDNAHGRIGTIAL